MVLHWVEIVWKEKKSIIFCLVSEFNNIHYLSNIFVIPLQGNQIVFPQLNLTSLSEDGKWKVVWGRDDRIEMITHQPIESGMNYLDKNLILCKDINLNLILS